MPKPVQRLESFVFRFMGIDPNKPMMWKEYAGALLAFNFVGLIVVFLIQVLQNHLPFNPQNLPNVSWHLALNTAVSFVTNTNWQSYSGESTLSYLTQAVALTVQNFVSAATGIAVAFALCRGLTRKEGKFLGNFWRDLTRSTLYLFLPLSFVLAVVLVSQGVIQNLNPFTAAVGLEGGSQVIPQGPVASQVAIKQWEQTEVATWSEQCSPI